MALTHLILIAFMTDNAALTDVGNLLDVQQDNTGGTYIANNQLLCFDAAVSWGRRTDSHIEYLLGQVCLLYGDVIPS